MKQPKNKRSTSRLRCHVPVDGKKGSQFASVQTVDISNGGIGLISRRRIPLDEKIAVEIDATAEGEPVLVLGKVVWVRKIADEERYRVGMKFQKAFTPQAQKILKRLISV